MVSTGAFADNAGGSGLVEYEISENSGFAGATWQSCPTASNCNFNVDWDLSTGDGLKTVYFRVRDAAGNISTTASNATALRLDTQALELSMFLQGTDYGSTISTTIVRRTDVQIQVSATDAGTGLSPATRLIMVSERADFGVPAGQTMQRPAATPSVGLTARAGSGSSSETLQATSKSPTRVLCSIPVCQIYRWCASKTGLPPSLDR